MGGLIIIVILIVVVLIVVVIIGGVEHAGGSQQPPPASPWLLMHNVNIRGKPSIRDFKDAVRPLFESRSMFLECLLVSCAIVKRFFESRDVETVPSNSIMLETNHITIHRSSV